MAKLLRQKISDLELENEKLQQHINGLEKKIRIIKTVASVKTLTELNYTQKGEKQKVEYKF